VAFVPNRIVVLYALAGQDFYGSKLRGESTGNTSTLTRGYMNIFTYMYTKGEDTPNIHLDWKDTACFFKVLYTRTGFTACHPPAYADI
jgi:hypothetical protein